MSISEEMYLKMLVGLKERWRWQRGRPQRKWICFESPCLFQQQLLAAKRGLVIDIVKYKSEKVIFLILYKKVKDQKIFEIYVMKIKIILVSIFF